MRTFFVGRHQKTWSSWCHAWVHQLLKDPEAKTSTTAALWSQSRATKVIHLSGCRSDLRNRFHSEVQFYGRLCPKKTYPYRLHASLLVESWNMMTWMKATSFVACEHRIGDAASEQMIDMPPEKSRTWVSKVSTRLWIICEIKIQHSSAMV